MTDDFDVFDDEDGLEEEKKGLKHLWNTNPLFKVGVVGAVLAAVGVGIVMFGSKQAEIPEKSDVGRAAEVTEPPGGEVTPVYKEAVEETNQQRAEEALLYGGSALPTPIGTLKSPLEGGELPEDAPEDPLAAWRQAAERRNLILPPADQGLPPDEFQDPGFAPIMEPITPPTPAGPQVQEGYIESLMEQMAAIIEAQTPQAAAIVGVTEVESAYRQKLAMLEEAKLAEEEAREAARDRENALEEGDIIVIAGSVLYAQLMNALNSDVPGPVLAQIVSGPLAGARAIGDFEKQEEFLTLKFHTVVQGEKVYDIDAVALDAETTLAGLVTDVDRHYFRRVVLPAAAAFVEGMGGAIAERESSVTVDEGTVTEEKPKLNTREQIAAGVEEAASTVGEVFDEESDRPITVKVAAGTPLGLFFVKSLKTTDEQTGADGPGGIGIGLQAGNPPAAGDGR